MAYYLKHYFDPDFNYQQRAPVSTYGGSVAHRYLAYVQNVSMGQVLAEFVPIGDEDAPNPKYIMERPNFPAGPNCVPDPENPLRLLAEKNGYVFYLDGKICVKILLNVRQNIGIGTGNIFFVNDLNVHGGIHAGFSVTAKNIKVRDLIEGAFVRATETFFAQNGFNGAGKGFIHAGRSIRLAFCENGELAAKENILIDQSCLNSTLYGGKNIMIKGRLQGGTVYANRLVVVGERLGGNSTSPTRIFMGHDPFITRQIVEWEQEIDRLRQKHMTYSVEAAKGEFFQKQYGPKCAFILRKLQIIGEKRKQLWEKISAAQDFSQCRVAVPGEIRPGTEITIGPKSARITDYFSCMQFFLEGNEIVMRPLSREEATSLSRH